MYPRQRTRKEVLLNSVEPLMLSLSNEEHREARKCHTVGGRLFETQITHLALNVLYTGILW